MTHQKPITKPMIKSSLVKRIIVYMIVLIALLVSILAVYSFTSYLILQNEVKKGAENFLQVYGTELRNRIRQMDGVLENLLVQNISELKLLKSSDEAKRFYAAQDIHNYIQDVALSNDSVDFLVVADSGYDICLDAASTPTTYWDRTAIREYTMEKTKEVGLLAEWNFIDLNNKTYLYKIYVYNNRAVAAFTSTTHFLQTIPDGDYGEQTFVLTDEEGMIQDSFGKKWEPDIIGLSLDQTDLQQGFIVEFSIVSGQIQLYSLVKNISIWNQTRVNTLVVLAVISFTILFGFLLIRYILKEIVHPLNSMAAVMNRIDQGEYNSRIEENYGTREFTHLRDSFNTLMDEILILKIQAYEKLIELKDAELKNIRLQLRPHFFLNAITTILSLCSKGKKTQLKQYVDSLSKNIRYMFKTRMHTVSIKEEIQHVENYMEMQEFKYPKCIFHYVDLPPELEEWKIPQMLIQTFIDNEYKYAVSIDIPLTILIRISTDIYQDEKMLLIEIEDDGLGYPQDVLAYMNGQGPKQVNDGNRIGLWSIKNLMELMYERRSLIYLSNIQPHGCLNRIWVPKKPVHESQNEEQDWLIERKDINQP
jgi:sensor histidine kinase YesM